MKVRLTVEPGPPDKPGFLMAKGEAPAVGVYGVFFVPAYAMAGFRTWLELVEPLMPGVEIEWAGSAVPDPLALPDQSRLQKLVKLFSKVMPKLARLAGVDLKKQIGPGDARS